jgi:zinc D-Ala-D-Ala carboxypeptidase
MKNYFSNTEQSCPCCDRNNIPSYFLKMANKARHYLGVPIYVNSWCRCPRHNREVEGTETSNHLEGIAFDVRMNSSKGVEMTPTERILLITALMKAGFNRFKIYKTFVHAGYHSLKQPVMEVNFE